MSFLKLEILLGGQGRGVQFFLSVSEADIAFERLPTGERRVFPVRRRLCALNFDQIGGIIECSLVSLRADVRAQHSDLLRKTGPAFLRVAAFPEWRVRKLLAPDLPLSPVRRPITHSRMGANVSHRALLLEMRHPILASPASAQLGSSRPSRYSFTHSPF